MTDKIKGEIVKRYFHQNKMVIIAKIEDFYTFRISNKASQKDYFSDKYETIEQCEKDSYTVAKKV